MEADIILCNNSGPVLRLDDQAKNRCPCCGKKNDFEILVEAIDVAKAFAVLAGGILARDPELFRKHIEEIEEWSDCDD